MNTVLVDTRGRLIHSPFTGILKVKKLYPDAKLPFRANEGDGGYDLSLYNEEVITPHSTIRAKTGLAVRLPKGTVGLIRSRSSMFYNSLSIVGTLDEGYTGELFLQIQNISNAPVYLKAGSRVGQLIVVPYYTLTLEETEDLGTSERGSNGFGSSGK